MRGECRAVVIPGSNQFVLRISQRPDPGFEHPWSTADVLRVLSFFPARWLCDLRFITFRQPTRREWPSDARCIGFVESRGEAGALIALNAVPTCNLLPGDASALDIAVARRLGATTHRRRFSTTVILDRACSRAFMLYHVLLHEVGHLVDADLDHDREAFAEAFALEWERRLRRAGLIPFAPIPDPEPIRLRKHGWSDRIRRRAESSAAP